MNKHVHAFAAALMVASLGFPAAARADDKDDEKKAEEDLDKAEGEQKKDQKPGEGAEGAPGGGLGEENPLPKILELMKNVESRLFDADTGDFTQDEQRQIVEAMKFEEKSHEALEELIKKIEEQMQQQQQKQQQQQQNQNQQQQKQQQQQNQNETPEQKRQREQEEQRRQEREKQAEAQRQMEKQKQQQQKQDQPQNEQESKAKQEQKQGQPPKDDQNPLDEQERRAGRWGQLPRKLFQDAANAANHEPPSKWSELIKRYRERLAETDEPSSSGNR